MKSLSKFLFRLSSSLSELSLAKRCSEDSPNFIQNKRLRTFHHLYIHILYVVTIARHNSGVREKETNPQPRDIPVTFGVNTVTKQKPPRLEADFGGEILIEITFKI